MSWGKGGFLLFPLEPENTCQNEAFQARTPPSPNPTAYGIGFTPRIAGTEHAAQKSVWLPPSNPNALAQCQASWVS